jgi:S-adenosylmethionine:tRNA ribosyltransferase-isomerase
MMDVNLEWLDRLALLAYDLPDNLVAAHPVAPRDHSRLLFYRHGKITDHLFFQLPELIPKQAVLVFNETKVIHARLFFHTDSGAKIEIFCLEPFSPPLHADNLNTNKEVVWKCLIGNNKRWKQSPLALTFFVNKKSLTLFAERLEQVDDSYLVRFYWEGPGEVVFGDLLEAIGEIPLPPYLNREVALDDEVDYQTIYAKSEGSVAAPTAGLHFTESVLNHLQERGVTFVFLTLHVSAGTFKPIKVAHISEHVMHQEQIRVSRKSLETLIRACQKNQPIIAVGTTSLRSLESIYWYGNHLNGKSVPILSVSQWEPYQSTLRLSFEECLDKILRLMDQNNLSLLQGSTHIMIVPNYSFRVISGIITNFHQPKSTLLLLIAAWVGEDWQKIYRYALDKRFRFLSFGDSSLLLKNS